MMSRGSGAIGSLGVTERLWNGRVLLAFIIGVTGLRWAIYDHLLGRCCLRRRRRTGRGYLSLWIDRSLPNQEGGGAGNGSSSQWGRDKWLHFHRIK
jgi:hypothetical protein